MESRTTPLLNTSIVVLCEDKPRSCLWFYRSCTSREPALDPNLLSAGLGFLRLLFLLAL
jgi:hypothetical protein